MILQEGMDIHPLPSGGDGFIKVWSIVISIVSSAGVTFFGGPVLYAKFFSFLGTTNIRVTLPFILLGMLLIGWAMFEMKANFPSAYGTVAIGFGLASASKLMIGWNHASLAKSPMSSDQLATMFALISSLYIVIRGCEDISKAEAVKAFRSKLWPTS